jgi:hypothetical protein
MDRTCSLNKEGNAYVLLVEKPEGKRPLGRSRYRWTDNVIIDRVEIGWGGMDLIGLDQDREKWRAVVKLVMNFWVP